MSESTPLPSRARRALAVLVGLFAVWQLVYLPAANLVAFVPLRPAAPPLESVYEGYRANGTFTTFEPLQTTADRGGDALERWSEVSAQEQGWSLFTPGTPPYSVFAAVEFRWPDGTSDTVLSQYEPRDYANPPVRPPLVYNRHFNFEMQFVLPVWYAAPENPNPAIDLPKIARVLQAELRAWLGWHLRDYLAANPHRDRPQVMILKHRYISTPKPDEPPSAPRTITERSFVRWWLALDTMDALDTTTMRFVPVWGARP